MAIIGNGFDLAHGYKTKFEDFVENTPNADLDTFRQFCNDENIENWNQFEKNIESITINLFQKNFEDNCDFNEISNKIAHVNQIFTNIHDLLLEFLKTETGRFQVQKKHNLEKYIDERTKVVNFNYTKVAEAYATDIFYIHGSIDEDNIVLGYDYRNEPCLISMEYMRWYKKFRRELLAFKRYLESEELLKSEDPDYKMLIENFEKYQMCANSGRGIDEEIEAEIKEFKKIDDFICNKCESRVFPDIDYKSIETVVVMGHGLESDEEFLKEILNKCTKLEKVTIFRYSGESDDSFNSKRAFFKEYCNEIYEEYYD